MTLIEAQAVLQEVSGKQYSWLKSWGLSTIREAIRTVNARKASTDADMERAENIERKISREW